MCSIEVICKRRVRGTEEHGELQTTGGPPRDIREEALRSIFRFLQVERCSTHDVAREVVEVDDLERHLLL